MAPTFRTIVSSLPPEGVRPCLGRPDAGGVTPTLRTYLKL